MYKVFYNDRTVFFVENDQIISDKSDSNIHHFVTKKQLKISLNKFLKNPEIKNLYIVHKDIESAFKKFMKLYKLIEAAGGLVKNNENKVLFIFRREKWDLPKGKLEKNESPEDGAVREVEEECGINNLNIQNHIETTYHTYNLKDKDILKRTYWYEMIYSGTENPKPQIEEEISEVKWISTNNLTEVMNNTFPSIIEVIQKASLVTGDF